jgi:hypothetical protein
VADDNPSPSMTAEDVAATISGAMLAMMAAMGKKDASPNQRLEIIADELRSLVDGMRARGDSGTPASEAMEIIAAMLEASAPDRAR